MIDEYDLRKYLSKAQPVQELEEEQEVEVEEPAPAPVQEEVSAPV